MKTNYYKAQHGALNQGAKASELILILRSEEQAYNIYTDAHNALDKAVNGSEDYADRINDDCTEEEAETLRNALEILYKLQGNSYAQALRTATKISRIK